MSNPWKPVSELAKTVDLSGFEYLEQQDLLVSRHDAVQRNVGFTWAYDVACPLLGMILDCEPIYFNYGGKEWLIEFWKGQYFFESGGEIGIYNREPTPPAAGDLTPLLAGVVWAIPGLVEAIRSALSAPTRETVTFYSCASDADELWMWFRLNRKNTVLFERGPERHWWLTGFKWGEFTESPSLLTMEVEITFPRTDMLGAFVAALNRPHHVLSGRGRPPGENLTVSFTFDIPKTAQPSTRTTYGPDKQAHNQSLVTQYSGSEVSTATREQRPEWLPRLDG